MVERVARPRDNAHIPAVPISMRFLGVIGMCKVGRYVDTYAFVEFRGKVNKSHTMCVHFSGSFPPPPPPTPPTPPARISSRPRRWRQGFDGVHRDGLALTTARYCLRPPSASRETSDDVSVLSSRSIKAPSIHCCGGLPSLYSRLSLPLGVFFSGGVLTHLSMAAWHPLR